MYELQIRIWFHSAFATVLWIKVYEIITSDKDKDGKHSKIDVFAYLYLLLNTLAILPKHY